jgi:hypothetical protein
MIPVSDTSHPAPPTPAQPRDAATVVLLRDSAKGVEVYLIKRSRMMDFMAGAHVFPGGRLDKNDSSASACALLSAGTAALHERLGEPLPAMQAAGLTSRRSARPSKRPACCWGGSPRVGMAMRAPRSQAARSSPR